MSTTSESTAWFWCKHAARLDDVSDGHVAVYMPVTAARALDPTQGLEIEHTVRARAVR